MSENQKIEFPEYYIDEIKNCINFVKDIYDNNGKNESFHVKDFRLLFNEYYKSNSKKDPVLDYFFCTIYFVGCDIFTRYVKFRDSMTPNELINRMDFEKKVILSYILQKDFTHGQHLTKNLEKDGK